MRGEFGTKKLKNLLTNGGKKCIMCMYVYICLFALRIGGREKNF